MLAKVLVTGGGGFIGCHLIDGLLRKDFEVTTIDIYKEIPPRLKHLTHEEKFNYITGDIRDRDFLAKIISDSFEKIFHFAAVVGVKNYCDDPLKTIDVNLGGTRNIIDIALSKNLKIVFASTSEIYGKNPRIPWNEDSDRVLGSSSIDRWSYGASKGVCEHMLFTVYRKYGLPMVILRFFNVYGPRQEPIFVIPAMIQKVLRNENPIVYNSGKQTRCFTFVKDVVQAIIEASENPKAEGEAFNIGNNQEVSIAELARLIIKIAGKTDKLKLDFIESDKVYKSYEDVTRRVPSITKAKELLGWEPKTMLEAGLKETIQWYRQWYRSV